MNIRRVSCQSNNVSLTKILVPMLTADSPKGVALGFNLKSGKESILKYFEENGDGRWKGFFLILPPWMWVMRRWIDISVSVFIDCEDERVLTKIHSRFLINFPQFHKQCQNIANTETNHADAAGTLQSGYAAQTLTETARQSRQYLC